MRCFSKTHEPRAIPIVPSRWHLWISVLVGSTASGVIAIILVVGLGIAFPWASLVILFFSMIIGPTVARYLGYDHYCRKIVGELKTRRFRVCPRCAASLEGLGDSGRCPRCQHPFDIPDVVANWKNWCRDNYFFVADEEGATAQNTEGDL